MVENLLLNTALEKFQGALTSEFAENFLQLLLGLMSVVFLVDHGFRKTSSSSPDAISSGARMAG